MQINQITLFLHSGNIYKTELAPVFHGCRWWNAQFITECCISYFYEFYDDSFPCFCFFCRLRTKNPRIPAWIFTADFSSRSDGDFDFFWMILPDSVSLPELLRLDERRWFEMSPGELIWKRTISVKWSNNVSQIQSFVLF